MKNNLIEKIILLLPKERILITKTKPVLDELGRINLSPTEQFELIADREWNRAISDIKQTLPQMLDLIREEIEEIDVSGGGSGRRLKEQIIINLLK